MKILCLKKAKEFTYKEKIYIQFINLKQAKYILLEKKENNICETIKDVELKNEIIENKLINEPLDVE